MNYIKLTIEQKCKIFKKQDSTINDSMEWVRNHIILKTKNFDYGIRGNEKSVRLAGVEIRIFYIAG